MKFNERESVVRRKKIWYIEHDDCTNIQTQSGGITMAEVRLTQVQMVVTDDKAENLQHASALIDRAVSRGSEIVCLPEMFTTPYSNDCFPRFAESQDGPTAQMLSREAAKHGIVLVGGSFPESDGGKLYNTALVFGPKGQLLAKHRKIHMFDISIQGKFSFKESDTLSPGRTISVFDTPFGRMGVAICFDIRFPELFRLMALNGANIILVPAAFNTVTGPAHWHMLARCRAVDNQVFIGVTSPARQEKGFKAYGHTLVTDPWGNILSEAGEEEALIESKLDMAFLNKIRQELPLLTARRTDIYQLTESVMPHRGTDI